MSVFGYSPQIIWRRVRYFFYLIVSYIFYKLKLTELSDKSFFDDKFISSNRKRLSSRLYEKLLSKTEMDVTNDMVEKIISGKLELFNYCMIKHHECSRRDPLTGYEWDAETWYRNGRKNISEGTDIKRPWEYSRMYFLLPLALNYCKTKDERISKYMIDYLKLWSLKNPVRTAPNWSCTMEVSIRVANIAVAYLLTSYSDCYTKLDHAYIILFIEEHLNFIRKNLENISKLTSNHYISNIAALYVVASIFPCNKHGNALRVFARKELENEIILQTLADGWNYELSSCYHRLVLEFFLFPYILSERNEFSDEYITALNSMRCVLDVLVKPNGYLTQIGDNDSGRFLVVDGFEQLGGLDMRKFCAYVDVNLGGNLLSNNFHKFENAKIYIYKTTNIYLLISCGIHGQYGVGGHSHDDTFSFELQLFKKDIVVDPGSGVYTSDKLLRNKFRSISQHNTLFWKNIEQSNLLITPFTMTQDNSVNDEIHCDDENLIFRGRNEYKGRWHERAIRLNFNNKVMEIEDRCSESNAIVTFNILEKLEAVTNNYIKLSSCEFNFSDAQSIEVIDSVYSDKYGVVKNINSLQIHVKEKALVTTIRY